MLPITFGLIAFNNEKKTLQRLQRDVLPAALKVNERYSTRATIAVVDNSASPTESIVTWLRENYPAWIFKWNDGANWMHSRSVNWFAIKYPGTLVYVCSQHGKSYDPSWAIDLIEAANSDPQAAMAGHVVPGSWDGRSIQFVQGGIFAVRTEVLRRMPFDEANIPHYWNDVELGDRFLRNGYKLIDVQSVRSAWRAMWVPRQTAPRAGLKYVHDESEA